MKTCQKVIKLCLGQDLNCIMKPLEHLFHKVIRVKFNNMWQIESKGLIEIDCRITILTQMYMCVVVVPVYILAWHLYIPFFQFVTWLNAVPMFILVPGNGLGTHLTGKCEWGSCMHTPTSIKGWVCPTLCSLSGWLWSRTHLYPQYPWSTLARCPVHLMLLLPSYSFCWYTSCWPRLQTISDDLTYL